MRASWWCRRSRSCSTASIAANLGFARPGTSIDDMEAVVGDLELDEWVDGLPDGLMTTVGQRGDELSAGERQLVALLRAGVVDPDVLVLDEATSSVDALTEVRISRALDAPRRGADDDRHRPPAVDRGPGRPGARARPRRPRRGRLATTSSSLAGGVYARLYDAWMAATTTEHAAFD